MKTEIKQLERDNPTNNKSENVCRKPEEIKSQILVSSLSQENLLSYSTNSINIENQMKLAPRSNAQVNSLPQQTHQVPQINAIGRNTQNLQSTNLLNNNFPALTDRYAPFIKNTIGPFHSRPNSIIPTIPVQHSSYGVQNVLDQVFKDIQKKRQSVLQTIAQGAMNRLISQSTNMRVKSFY